MRDSISLGPAPTYVVLTRAIGKSILGINARLSPLYPNIPPIITINSIITVVTGRSIANFDKEPIYLFLLFAGSVVRFFFFLSGCSFIRRRGIAVRCLFVCIIIRCADLYCFAVRKICLSFCYYMHTFF